MLLATFPRTTIDLMETLMEVETSVVVIKIIGGE